MSIEKLIQDAINDIADVADKHGSCEKYVCDMIIHPERRQQYLFKDEIISALIARGYRAHFNHMGRGEGQIVCKKSIKLV